MLNHSFGIETILIFNDRHFGAFLFYLEKQNIYRKKWYKYNKYKGKVGKIMIEAPEFKVGDSITIQKTVKKEDTALNYGSGKLDNLLATPSLVALMIEASVNLIDEDLPDGYISVGKMSKVVHENPTVLGETISVKVEIKDYDGSKILLEMTAYDEVGLVGRGTHQRIIVNKKGLLKKAHERVRDLENKDF